MKAGSGPSARPAVAWVPVGLVTAAIAALLGATITGYDYHRDELYFRLLSEHPAWGYVDQPPLTPMLAKLAIAALGDTVWAIRVPALLAVAAAAVLAALIARELGGGAGAQALAAAGVASAFPLIAGHLLLTATTDLVIWLLVILLAMRALLRDRPRYWLGAGAVAGIGLYNRHLVVLLLIGLGAGLLIAGPRRVLASGWLWGGAALALAVGSPNLVYQVTHDFPQLDMAAALAENKGDEARVLFVPMQIILLGPPLVPIWVAGLVALLRDPAWRPVRALAVAYPVICVLLLLIAGQPYYTMGLLLALYAAGSVVTVRWLARGGAARRALVGLAVAVNVAVSAVIALPLLPVDVLARTPIPEINQGTRDQIGWPAYVRQVADVFNSLPDDERRRAVVITGNYGEAGALARYGRPYGVTAIYSGQNELWHLGPPPAGADVVVTVGIGGAFLERAFARCVVASRLANGVDIDNEEEGVPVRVCRGPRSGWAELWPAFQHFD